MEKQRIFYLAIILSSVIYGTKSQGNSTASPITPSSSTPSFPKSTVLPTINSAPITPTFERLSTKQRSTIPVTLGKPVT